jgi:hypothetical protein
MKNLKIFYSVIVVCVVVVGIYLILTNSKKEPDIIQAVKEPVSLCYIYSNKTDRGFYDKASIRLDINGENVSGEFKNIPAEKDSKVGKFKGTVGPLDKEIMGRTANLWWDSMAEGMQVKEELIIEFGDGSASALFGEMVDRGDGVYVYKNKNELSFGTELWQISCEDLVEKEIVEKYIKDNIKNIASNDPVLGGSWYVLSINTVPSTNSGEVAYEDGHIQSKATFTYEYVENPQSVIVKTFVVNK